MKNVIWHLILSNHMYLAGFVRNLLIMVGFYSNLEKYTFV